MIFEGFDNGVFTVELYGPDLERLAALCYAAWEAGGGADAAESRDLENLALMFTSAALASRLYGMSAGDEATRDRVRAVIERCGHRIRTEIEGKEESETR